MHMKKLPKKMKMSVSKGNRSVALDDTMQAMAYGARAKKKPAVPPVADGKALSAGY